MSCIINIIILPFIYLYSLLFYVYSYTIGLIVGLIREYFQNRHRPQQIIEKFRNYDNLKEEERTIDSAEGLEEEHWDVLGKIVRSWFEGKILDDDRCQFISEVSTSLLKDLIKDVEHIPFTEKDYKQLVCIYKYINYRRPYRDYYDCTLECAEYFRRYWLESGDDPLPINNKSSLDYSKMGYLSLKDLEELKSENKQQKCYYIAKDLYMSHKKEDKSVLVQLFLYGDKLEIYKCNKKDILDENENIVIRKGTYETILLRDINDIKFNDWEEVIQHERLEDAKSEYNMLKDNGDYENYKNNLKNTINRLEKINKGKKREKEFLMEIYCIDKKSHYFSDARELDVLIIRALMFYFIQKLIE